MVQIIRHRSYTSTLKGAWLNTKEIYKVVLKIWVWVIFINLSFNVIFSSVNFLQGELVLPVDSFPKDYITHAFSTFTMITFGVTFALLFIQLFHQCKREHVWEKTKKKWWELTTPDDERFAHELGSVEYAR
jgi:hypothetical protein